MQTTLDTEQVARIAQGLAHPIRVKIDEILENKKRKMTVSELQESLKQFGDIYTKDYSNIRKHLTVMHDAGIIELRKDIREGYVVELKVDIIISIMPTCKDDLKTRNLVAIE